MRVEVTLEAGGVRGLPAAMKEVLEVPNESLEVSCLVEEVKGGLIQGASIVRRTLGKEILCALVVKEADSGSGRDIDWVLR